ncbi:galactose-1-epimerase [Hymenobacter sp. DH14]|uniref:Aldose 1-epimerase n=1 Tax=Hymenobacter cyanobacteriorum TaxID=2926463 RepID=A0A9X2ADZ9_9BACT|nr:aldose epimerase family protein [Hymenobacter cyanobacteriorum]MCI1186711.1 galactose-1-epimerase [Hymenobacter cyanobacteriorum]
MSFRRSGLLAVTLPGLLLLAACGSNPSAEQTTATAPAADSTSTKAAAMPTSASFGKALDGTEIQLFTLTNKQGAKAAITNYAGTLVSLMMPDKDGKMGDVVLGFDSVSDYQSPAFRKANPYIGALIGRYGNRIAKGKFTLDGKQYQLPTNNGANSLHGGKTGYDQRIWEATPGTSAEGQTLTLKYLSKDGEEGYPGNLQITVVYTLTDANALQIDYTATTDKATVVNLTNHAYFNLSHGVSKDILAHKVTIPADRYTVVDADLIPTGELRPVKGTPFDFTTPHAIGERIAQVPGGYDHNWVLNNTTGQHSAATVYDPASGRTMEVTTDQPGIQFYTGNFLDGTLKGKGGTVYGKHAGFCLETQHFPDSPNQPKFPSTVLKPGETYHTVSTYTFGVRK